MKARRYPCAWPPCRRSAVVLGGCCSRSCARRLVLARTPPEARSAQMKRAVRLRFQRDINRMLQRVKVLADSEDERLVLAWRYGKSCAKVQRYRQKTGAAA